MKNLQETRGRLARLLDRFVMLFFEHKHKWKEYKMICNNDRTYLYCRECDCGSKQIQNAGPMGNNEWQDQSIPFTHKFEQEWFDDAKRI